MIDLTKNRLLIYPFFGSLYFLEGIIYALATVIIPIYFIEKGIDLSITTIIVGLTSLPWVLKFIFGGIVDYFNLFGRKRFIIIGELLSATSLFIISTIDPKTALIPFTLLILLASTGVAFLDVSADAWAIQLSTEKNRGKLNAAMYAGQFLGMAFCTSVIGNIAGMVGYHIAFICSGFLIIIVIIFSFIFKEEITIKTRLKIRKFLIQEFKNNTTKLIAFFGLLSSISFGLLGVVIPIYMKTALNLEIGQIGIFVSIGPLSTLVGNVIGGFLTDKYGRKKSLFLFLGLNLIFSTGLIFASSWQKLIILWSIIGFLHGGHYTIISAMFMDITNPKIGAAQYSILSSLTNVGEMGGTSFSGTLITTLGFSRIFLYSGWMYGPLLLILYFINLKSYFKKYS
jgi:MFS family permease